MGSRPQTEFLTSTQPFSWYSCSFPFACTHYVLGSARHHCNTSQCRRTCIGLHRPSGERPSSEGREPRRTETTRKTVAGAKTEPGTGREAGRQTGEKDEPPRETPKHDRKDTTGVKNLDTRITESGAYPSPETMVTVSQAVRICAGPRPRMSLDRVFSAWPSCGTVVQQHESSLGTQWKTSHADLA